MTETHGERELAAAAAEIAAGHEVYDFDQAGSVDLPPRPDGESMVVRSLRLSVDLEQRVKEAASARKMPVSALLREWIEHSLADLENDQPISRADALRAVAALRPVANGRTG
jgi:predicted DNA-binding protein